MSNTGQKYDFIPDLDNPSNVHHIELSMVADGSRVLDVGCHTGILGGALIARKQAHVVGIDTDAAALEVARTRLTDAQLVDIERAGWSEVLAGSGGREFDVILFGDVLEHTRDPLAILREAKKLLARGGRIVVSIPNVAHWRVRFGLLLGSFEYTESGILDRTHLRFFTQRTARAMLHEAGYTVVASDVAGYRLPHWLIRACSGLLAIQLVFAATPADAG